MAAIIHPLAHHDNVSVVTVTDIEGKKQEWPTVSCCHCGRVYSLRPGGKTTLQQMLDSLKQCVTCSNPGKPRYVCPSPACRVGCNPFKADLERAERENHRQPWMLREGALNEPVLRIWTSEGEQLIPRRQSGFTERELAKMARPSGGANDG